jgi:hypothetical protein
LDLLGPLSEAFLLHMLMTTNQMNEHDDSYFLHGAAGKTFKTQEGVPFGSTGRHARRNPCATKC